MYPEIHPFRDSREYLSIAPKDFVVLCKEYQKLVHNSFLLHGYYNYRHLILGRIRQKDAWQYYIGVPGNFYDREKMVAEMFGFEAFEGEKNPTSPGGLRVLYEAGGDLSKGGRTGGSNERKMTDSKNPLAGMKRGWYAFSGNSQQISGRSRYRS